MINLIKAIYQRKIAENDAERERVLSESRMVSEASQIVVDRPDKDGWVRLFGANDREKGMLQANQLEMIRKAREFFRFDPNAHAAISTLLNYVLGKGVSITPKSDDPMLWYVWREFWTADRNKMQLKQFEIVRRTFRDGEIFIEFFTDDQDKDKTGKTTIRFVDPLLVRAKDATPADAMTQTINNGVVTDPEDIEKVLSYTVQNRADPDKYRDVPASRMYHIKINVDSDQKRGETIILSIMNLIRHYEQWLENRIILNKMRSAIVLLKKITGTPSEVANMASTLPTARNPSNESKKQNFRGGTIITAGPGVEYDMLSPNINANDAKEDGRNIKLSMAAALNMPEYIFGDASNSNYASSLISESPFVKAIQFWQIFFEYHFGQIFKKVIEAAVEAKTLEAPDDEEFLNQLKSVRNLGEADSAAGTTAGDKVPQSAGAATSPTAKTVQEPVDPAEAARDAKLRELMPNGKMETPSEIFFGCDMTWPEIVHREMKQQVDALSIARQNGWIADSTATAALGYDYPEEVRKQKQIEEESEKQGGNPLLGTAQGDLMGDSATMDAELQDMLNGLSPEERDSVLKAKDPREVVRIMGKRKTPAAAGEGE
jgi:hypothetical protein